MSEFAPVYPHGEIREVFPGIFFVTGSAPMGPGMRCSRNMTILRQGGDLFLFNTVRLDENGLAALDKLGTVKGVFKLAGFHGMDDPFYKDRYNATVYAAQGQTYFKGFSPDKGEIYFEPDVFLNGDSSLPIKGADYKLFSSPKPTEAVVRLEAEGGILISGDSMQNWSKVDSYFTLLGGLMMKLFGFIKPTNIGPGWVKVARPKPAEVESILGLEFEHLLPAHGSPVIGGAKTAYKTAIDRAVKKLQKQKNKK